MIIFQYAIEFNVTAPRFLRNTILLYVCEMVYVKYFQSYK